MPYPYYDSRPATVADLIGLTLESITGEVGGDEIVFTSLDGCVFKLLHFQDCCENVYIEDIVGDLQDLVGSPILTAEEVSSEGHCTAESDHAESCTWTFYKFSTQRGYVDIRWFGSSNGYYGEGVDFIESPRL